MWDLVPWAFGTGNSAQAGDHNLKRAISILGLCNGVFTDRFIFIILQHFFLRKKHHVKTSENTFLSPVSTDGLVRLILYSKFAENPSKNKMDAIARALESCSLRLMGSWLKKSGIRVANDWDPDYMK